MRDGYIAIADRLEASIRAGRLKPNEALPNTRDLAKEMNVSLVTMQRCMKRLHERGLVRRSPQKGTFVSGSVNSRTIGFMIGNNPFSCESPFYRLVAKAYCQLAPQFGSEVKLYLNMIPNDPYHSVRMAEKDLADGNLKALLMTGYTVVQKEWAERKALCPCLHLPSMDIRDLSFRGVSLLLGAGRRKIKVVSTYIDEWPPDQDEELPGVEDAFRGFGLAMPAGTVARCGYRPAEVYAFVRECAKEGLDGLLVNHDVVAPAALYALAEAGLSVPDDVLVASHQNKGAEIFSPNQLETFTADSAELVRKGLELCLGPNSEMRDGMNFSSWRLKTVHETRAAQRVEQSMERRGTCESGALKCVSL